MVHSILHVFNDVVDLMDKCSHADMVGVDGSDGSVDVVEVSKMVYQLWIVLYISEISFCGAGSVTIWIS